MSASDSNEALFLLDSTIINNVHIRTMLLALGFMLMIEPIPTYRQNIKQAQCLDNIVIFQVEG